MTDEQPSALGGCSCGAVRYRVGKRISGGMICHCRMCQRATGTAFSLNAIYVRDSLEITRGEPTWFASSNIAERSFCSRCGSALFIRYSVPEWQGWIAVTVGSHDAPERIPPEHHFGTESQMHWLVMDDGLPRSSYPETFLDDVAVDSNAAYGALPRRS